MQINCNSFSFIHSIYAIFKPCCVIKPILPSFLHKRQVALFYSDYQRMKDLRKKYLYSMWFTQAWDWGSSWKWQRNYTCRRWISNRYEYYRMQYHLMPNTLTWCCHLFSWLSSRGIYINGKNRNPVYWASLCWCFGWQEALHWTKSAKCSHHWDNSRQKYTIGWIWGIAKTSSNFTALH